MNNEIYLLKSACLFHDPPTKAWDICKGRKHEEQAEKIADKVLKDSILESAIFELNNIKVRQSDYLASSVDRWLLSKIVSEDFHKFPFKKIKIKNIFNPSFSQEVKDEIANEKVYEFAEALNKIVKSVRDTRLAYHVLYASYEPLWIKNGFPSLPADTRTPSHSVFDHNYATASMINWFLGGKNPKGILLYIDLGSVQRFIAHSRKLSDLWLSSYLASVLAWSVFWIFVRILGPDIMVLPTCRGNSFYYHSLISELIANGVDKSVIEVIKNISKEFAGYNPDEDNIPKYAIIPTTATLILPELNELKKLEPFRELRELKDLENFVSKRYEEIWNKIYDKIIEVCECTNMLGELGDLATHAGRLLKECKKFNFDKTPPLPIRVIALSTDKLTEFDVKEDSYDLYHNMFKLLAYEEGKRKIYKFRPEENLDLYNMTSQHILDSWPIKSKRGFEYCTVCGSLPAIISLPSNEEEYTKYLDIGIEPIFSLGERFCPLCLIKRLLTKEKILKPIIDELLGKVSDNLPSRKFISVCDITLMPFKKTIVMKGIALNKDTELSEQLSRMIGNIQKEIEETLGKEAMKVREPILNAEKFLLEKIREISHIDLRGQLVCLVFLDNAESIFMKDFKLRKAWIKLIRNINNDGKMRKIGGKVESLNTYYAIVRSDGDNLGKIIRGEIKDGFRVEVKDYLFNILEGDSKELINYILKKEKEKAKELCKQEGIANIDEKIEEISKFIDYLQNINGIFISPSYHCALSRALMNNATRDAKIIDEHNGLVVYSGGDDLLAVMPVKDCLNAVKKLREKFSFPSEHEGFDKKYNYITPSMVTASRSFSVYLTHYMFPMYAAINNSATLLDELAKKTNWSFKDALHDKEAIVEKDTLVLSYSPRGKELSSLLPLSTGSPNKKFAKTLEYVEKLLLDIEDGKFSVSLIYDFYSNFQTIKLLAVNDKKTLLKFFLRKIFEKNCEIKDEQQKHEKIIEWTEMLTENYNAKEIKNGAENELLLNQLFLTLMLYRSGLRGIE